MRSLHTLKFPGDIFRFLYWVFFRPITLERYLYAIDSTPGSSWNSSETSLVGLWRRLDKNPHLLSVIQLTLLSVLMLPLGVFLVAYLVQVMGGVINWPFLMVGVLVGVMVGLIFSLTFTVVIGVAFGVVFSLAGGIAFGMESSMAISMAGGAASGIAISVAFGVPFGMTKGTTLGIGLGIVVGFAFGVAVNITSEFSTGLLLGFTRGLAVIFSFLLGYFRIPLYLLEVFFMWFYIRLNGTGKIVRSPVDLDEIIWFPLPYLDILLVRVGMYDRRKGKELIAEIAASFRQKWAAHNAILELTAYDMHNANSLEAIKAINTLAWSPEGEQEIYRKFFLYIEQLTRYAHAALESETAYNRQEKLKSGLTILEKIRQNTLDELVVFLQYASPALKIWEDIFAESLSKVNTNEITPNVYIAGPPLMKNSKSYKGRKDLFISLNNEFINASGQRSALILFGARRMGKTSTLMQLPIQLGPEAVPVFIDLQKLSSVENAAGLLYSIEQEIVKCAYEERHLKLMGLPQSKFESDPYLAILEWLDYIGKELGGKYWILLALDEFEYLDEMLKAGRIDERIFQLLRGVIQGHPQLTVMMSGSHTLEELPPYWSNYFINTKILKVTPLSEEDAVELITAPIENFPLNFEPSAIDYLLKETGCHPNWLQQACHEIVDKMNREKRFVVQLEDAEFAIDQVPERLSDFRDFWLGNDSDDLKRDILRIIAKEENGVEFEELAKSFGESVPELKSALMFFLRRDILIAAGSIYAFRANLLRRWINKQSY